MEKQIIFNGDIVKIGDLIKLGTHTTKLTQNLMNTLPAFFEVFDIYTKEDMPLGVDYVAIAKESYGQYDNGKYDHRGMTIEKIKTIQGGSIACQVLARIDQNTTKWFAPEALREINSNDFQNICLGLEIKKRYPEGSSFYKEKYQFQVVEYKYSNVNEDHLVVVVKNGKGETYFAPIAELYSKTDGIVAPADPLFKTEDGKVIYFGDEFYFVQTGPNTGNDKKAMATKDSMWKVVKFGNGARIDLTNDNIKRFYSCKKANQFVIDNAPDYITEDGVGLYNGDSYCWVDMLRAKKENYKINSYDTCVYNTNKMFPADTLIFSNTRMAKKYITAHIFKMAKKIVDAIEIHQD